MTIFTCEHNWESILSCIYAAFDSRLGHKNIRLTFEPVEQYTLFDDYIHVDVNLEHAQKMMDTINLRISSRVYSELAFSAMSCAPDAMDNIYRVLLLGFNYGPNVLEMVQYADVMRSREIRLALGREMHHFVEFSRFHRIQNGAEALYVAHIEPKSPLVITLGDHFSDRMPSEHWMIVDDIHKEALIHPKDEDYYLRKLTDEELEKLLLTESVNDEYTHMWKTFFDTIAIKQLRNPRCQTNLYPNWTRKHAVEFMV